MTLDETLKQLKALGNEKVRAHNTKYGAGDNQFGNWGDVRDVATDADELEDNYSEWLQLAELRFGELQSRGLRVEKVDVDNY